MMIKTTVLILIVIALFSAAARSNPDTLRRVQSYSLKDTLEPNRHLKREQAAAVEENPNDDALQMHQLVYDGISFDDYWSH